MTNNLIVFATFWNEIDWIHASLAQIDILDPIEVIICDGCFDPSHPNYSTDGTREIIKEWVQKRSHAKLISAKRYPKWLGILKLYKGHTKSKNINLFSLTRLKTVALGILNHEYRINQALTFQHMISISKCWIPGRWFMTYDSDQFYTDKLISNIVHIINSNNDYGLITARERTFFEDFSMYTDEYEKRNFNNLPHKIYSSTTIQPTRGVVIENFSLPKLIKGTFFESDYYAYRVPQKSAGWYNHYKFKFSHNRLAQGYALGDRKAPDTRGMNFKKFSSNHPDVIRKYFGEKL